MNAQSLIQNATNLYSEAPPTPLLLLSSDGEAGVKLAAYMGLYSLMEGVTHNKMPVWVRDLKDYNLFYGSS